MIPQNVPLDQVPAWESLWVGISSVFADLGFGLFHYGWLGHLIVLILLVAGARFVWSFVKGVL